MNTCEELNSSRKGNSCSASSGETEFLRYFYCTDSAQIDADFRTARRSVYDAKHRKESPKKSKTNEDGIPLERFLVFDGWHHLTGGSKSGPGTHSIDSGSNQFSHVASFHSGGPESVPQHHCADHEHGGECIHLLRLPDGRKAIHSKRVVVGLCAIPRCVGGDYEKRTAWAFAGRRVAKRFLSLHSFSLC